MSEPNVKGRWESFLPDEIVINILSRLPAKDVLRCQCVVKRWRDLTSTAHFLDLHKQCCIDKLILVDLRNRNRRNQFFLDEWWITTRKKPATQKIYGHPYSSSFSHDGLLVMSSDPGWRRDCAIAIINPIFREKVNIVISEEWHSSIRRFYGVYFNPSLNEYCALFDVTPRSSHASIYKPPPVTYKMLTLGPKPCLRDIRNPYKDSYPTRDLQHKRPAMFNGFLYWMIDLGKGHDGGIMEFDTRINEFKLMRYPAQMTDYGRFDLDLLNVGGFLALVQLGKHLRAVDVNIWTLKDRASELWTSSQFHVNSRVYPSKSWGLFETIAVSCGEILIRSELRLYVCNLEGGRTRRVIGNNRPYNAFSKFLSHDICLRPLKNCKSVIRIGNKKKCLGWDRLDKEETSSSNSAVYEHSDVVEEITISGLDEGAGTST